MTLSVTRFSEIRDVVESLLVELNLEACLFAIEPKDDKWELTVECAGRDGWKNIRISVNQTYIQHGADDSVIHNLLLSDWRDALSECLNKK